MDTVLGRGHGRGDMLQKYIGIRVEQYMEMHTENIQQIAMLLEGKDSIDKFRRTIMQYECAMLEIKTKLDVLNTELSLQKSRNPFETIKCRIKSP